MLKAFSSFFIFSLSLQSLARDQDPERRHYSHRGDSTLRFKDLQDLLDGKQAPDNIERFLKALSQRDPIFFKYFTLMRSSRSLQEGLPENPRVIVYGSDSKLIFTFNGNEKQKGGQALEIIHFDEKKMDFEFREIQFSSKSRPQISKANPEKCMRCHGVNLKPIWDEYREWVGAYGHTDDVVRDFGNDRQLTDFRNFLSLKNSHPRYKYLIISGSKETSPYESEEFGDYRYRPNLRLTVQLTDLQLQRFENKIFKDPLSEFYELYALDFKWSCGIFRENPSWKNLLKKSFEELEFSSIEEGARGWDFFGIDYSMFNTNFNPLNWSFFEGTRDSDNIFMDRLLKTFSSRRSPLTEFEKRINEEESSKSPEEQDAAKKNEVLCSQLEAAGIENAVAHFEKRKEEILKVSDLQKGAPRTIQMCMTCHNGSEDKSIARAFDNPQWLATRPEMQKKILERISLGKRLSQDQMPPERPLGVFERMEVKAYLRNLK